MFEVIVIGAGAAGLMAARELALQGKKVAILEARDRIGGRAHTLYDPAFSIPVELGAEFIHGSLPITLGLLDEAHIGYTPVKGSVWRSENGNLQEEEEFLEHTDLVENKLNEVIDDISVADFIAHYLKGEELAQTRQSLKSFVEGYDAADINIASTLALKHDLSTPEGNQYRIEGGYNQLMQFLNNSIRQHQGVIFLSSPVTDLHWKAGEVQLTIADQVFTAQKTIITVPLGVLQADRSSPAHIRFDPAIPQKIEIAKSLGFGNVIKINLQFSEVFWKEKMKDMSFLFSQEAIPTWWSQYPATIPTLTGWLAGPNTAHYNSASEEEVLHQSLQSLANIYNVPTSRLQQLLSGYHITNWQHDPYAAGAYSFATVNGNRGQQALKEPIANTIFFAGEALQEGPKIGTVEGALASGKEAAGKVMSSF